ncbi:MAG: DUF1707 domain-containing protein [Pseudonocardiales bacterium]|jgi:hypothetical protein|nr:DUF1707 domain-containing protein [Pseudonocardiales bacterium]
MSVESVVRVGTTERERAGARLGQAFALGYLDLAEYEQRLDRSTRAVTGADLQALFADLPVGEIERRDPARRERARALARRGAAAHVGAYVLGMALMVGIWLVVGLTAGAWYPWPVWPALGWGIGVASHVLPVLVAGRRG